MKGTIISIKYSGNYNDVITGLKITGQKPSDNWENDFDGIYQYTSNNNSRNSSVRYHKCARLDDFLRLMFAHPKRQPNDKYLEISSPADIFSDETIIFAMSNLEPVEIKALVKVGFKKDADDETKVTISLPDLYNNIRDIYALMYE